MRVYFHKILNRKSIVNQNLEKLKVLVNIIYLFCFLRDMHVGNLSIEKAANKQSNFANELKKFDTGIETLENNFK